MLFVMLSACGNISADNVENNNIETEEGNNITDDELIDLAFKEDEKNDNQGVYEPDFETIREVYLTL